MYPSLKSRASLPLAACLAAACLALGGCAGTQPNRYGGLASSAQLRPNPDDRSGRVPYEYSTPVNWRNYSSLIIEPVALYRGADHQFEEMSEEDKTALARYMQVQFEEKLGSRFIIADQPASRTLRLKLTLTGAKANTRVLSTVSRFDLAGGSYNVVQAVRGKEGAFTGSVTYAVEIFDASNNLLLRAYVTKQYPSPMNIGASLGALDASKAGISKGADELAAQLLK